MGQTDRTEAIPPDDDDAPTRLGPPGWAEFAGARARFMRTLDIERLETAWTAPALEPVRHDRGERRS